jgi:hypothetical protein
MCSFTMSETKNSRIAPSTSPQETPHAPNHCKQPEAAQSAEQAPSSSMASMTSLWYNDMTEMITGNKNKKSENENETEKQHQEDETAKESMICSTIRSIRLKYLERQLVGKIFIHRLCGVISTAVTSEVTAEDISNYYLKLAETNGRGLLDKDPLVQAELTGQYRRALSTVDTLLNSLERRSLAYSSADFGNSTMLTRGTSIGVNDPFFHLIGFSFTMELSATAHSLIASRKRYEVAREMATSKKKRDDAEMGVVSPLSMLSFNLFGKKENPTEEKE